MQQSNESGTCGTAAVVKATATQRWRQLCQTIGGGSGDGGGVGNGVGKTVATVS
jgi:hypothetical protein